MKRTDFDVAIIGGGIAGLSLAIELSSAGISTCVFEKEKYPFHKVCGEYVSMESFPYLKRSGLALENYSLPRIRKLHVTSSDGSELYHPLHPGGFGISRHLLDNLLCERARSAGATIMEGTRVSSFRENASGFLLESSAGSFSSRLLAGAHGKRSNPDRLLGRNFISGPGRKKSSWIAVKYHIRTSLSPDTIELHNFSEGYCGVSAIEEDRFCLCYLTRTGNLSNNSGSIEQMEKNVLTRNPFLKKHLEKSERLYTEPLVISQVSFAPKSACEGNVLMTGDSAGLIAPVCGNGMSMAFRSSQLLSGYIILYIQGKIGRDTLMNEYSKRWRALFMNRVLAGRFIQALMGREYITGLTLRLLNHSPALTRKLVSLSHGDEF
jgi:menaquinone-9 beta-reductase